MEIFRQLLGREEILTGLLGADIVGFQQQLSVRNFLSLAHYLLGVVPGARSGSPVLLVAAASRDLAVLAVTGAMAV
jgi:trehalose-6-phosphate synthase